ncbi:unnamed protein product [Brugia pahangi]|uniref:UDP-galactose translocator n=1 Tax=Brugia pahangi TaxID=6280 RepID=A0A0N4SWZ8_BRUPA|nr:unnamed protein product [Brugia pahangi]
MTEKDNEVLADHNQHLVKKFYPMNISVVRKRTESQGIILQLSALIWLTLQNSSHTLLLRYSRVRVVEKVFLPSVAVFYTELLKLIICLLFIIYEEKSVCRLFNFILKVSVPSRVKNFPCSWMIIRLCSRVNFSMLNLVKRQVFYNLKDTFKVCIPAVIYIIQNNLFYLAASHLEAVTYMVTAQLKIFTTAIFAVIMLKRTITRKQWLSLGVLFVGVCLVQLDQQGTKKTFFSDPYLGSTFLILIVNSAFLARFLASVSACILSGFAGTYFEKILNTSPSVSVWIRNVQLALFGIPSSFTASFMKDHETIFNEGMLYGFDMLVWVVVFWYCIGGLSVAVCIKYSGNIAKNFATSAAIVISMVASIYLFDFIPNPLFLLGTGLVITSIFLYSS